jgi:hypothetical protein
MPLTDKAAIQDSLPPSFSLSMSDRDAGGFTNVGPPVVELCAQVWLPVLPRWLVCLSHRRKITQVSPRIAQLGAGCDLPHDRSQPPEKFSKEVAHLHLLLR